MPIESFTARMRGDSARHFSILHAPMNAPADSTFAQDVADIGRIPAIQTMLEVICRTTKMGFAAVARVTAERWIACAVQDEIGFGLKPGGELEVRTTICDEIRASGKLVVIDHVANDPVFCNHHTPVRYGIQSYISVPITLPGGEFFGTLCAIDPRPNKLNTPEILGMFELFASLIAFHLDAQDRVTHSEKALLDERASAELREQFIAVMGHDLRSPLAAITSAAAVLGKVQVDERAGNAVPIIQRSAARMRDLIENVMDLARGRLGGGLSMQRRPVDMLGGELQHVIDEQRTAWPQREIVSDIQVDRAVNCDPRRMAQLAANLVANALTHGDPSAAVHFAARTIGDRFELSVANKGNPIPEAWMGRLFQPFARGRAQPGQEGLGLGLYIASQIAHEHGGTLDVVSTREETRFTLRMTA
jgi:signal transduction histidine kinase